MDTFQAIAERRSVRSFLPDPIPKETLEKIVDAGRQAATARNIQPWTFVVVENENHRRRMAALADNGTFIAQAPACLAVFCRETKYYLEDGCSATANILLAAAALGVGSCWVAGDKKGYAGDIAELLGASPDQKLVALIALGRPRPPLPAPSKRSLADVVKWESF